MLLLVWQWAKCGLEHLLMRRGVWRDKQLANARKKEMFADITEASAKASAKKSSKSALAREEEKEGGDMDAIFAKASAKKSKKRSGNDTDTDTDQAPAKAKGKGAATKRAGLGAGDDSDIAQAIRDAGAKRRTKAMAPSKPGTPKKKPKFVMS
jgi:hypothetical protein